MGSDSSIALDSSFKFDGIDIWNYLANLGFTFLTAPSKTTFSVEIYYEGKSVGKIFSTNMGKDYFSGKELVPKLAGRGYYIIEGTNQYMDILFLYAVAFARTEKTLDHD